jgi:hypothetical protein
VSFWGFLDKADKLDKAAGTLIAAVVLIALSAFFYYMLNS